MPRFFPPKMLEGEALSSLSSWQLTFLISLILFSILLFTIAVLFNKKKKFSFVCFIAAISVFIMTFLLIFTFPYSNSFGWVSGGQLFLTLLVLLIASIFFVPAILYLCLGVTSLRQLRDWTLWAYLIGGLTVLSASIGTLSHLLQKTTLH